MKKSIIIYDTEYTSWEGAQGCRWSSPGQHRELVQIAALRWEMGNDWRSGEIFHSHVKPLLNPKLSPYFKKLTGNKQSQVDRSPSAKKVLADFSKFTGNERCWSNGNDINILAETAGLQGFVLPLDPLKFYSLYPEIYKKLERTVGAFDPKKYPSGELYKILKIKLSSGNAHNAFHDVNSLCATIEGLQNRGIDMSYLWTSKPQTP